MMESSTTTTRVTILGSGTCVPSLQRSACSVLAATGGLNLLFDSGPGTMRRLMEAGKSIFEIDYVFYSHFHPDHTAELVPLLFATKYPYGDRRRSPLTIVAGEGFGRFYNGLKEVYDGWIELEPGRMLMVELSGSGPDRFDGGRFTVDSLPARHRPESVAFCITDSNGRRFVYSGDTDYTENLIALARDADLLILESALPDALKVEGHLTPSLAGEIATRAAVKRLALTHFYPECDQADIRAECRKTYAGPLILAEDLMEIGLQ